MAQTGYTPISIYNSATTTNVPTAGNLVAGELAINTADGKLFYKDSSGVVQTIASKAGNINVSSFSGGSTGLTPNTATTGVVTLAGTLASANGGTGQTNITFPSSGGTAMVSGNMPAFSYYAGVATSISNGAWTKVLFNTSDFDTTSGMFASSRFTPTIAGYYQISGGILQGSITSSNNSIAIYKNGNGWKNGSGTGVVAGYVYSNVSGLVYLNGSTDYVEIYALQNSGSAQNCGTGGVSTTYFQGVLVRSA